MQKTLTDPTFKRDFAFVKDNQVMDEVDSNLKVLSKDLDKILSNPNKVVPRFIKFDELNRS
jgi:hypothetical protein